MAKFFSILVLLLWIAAAAAAVLLFKKKGKRANLLCAGALVLCIALLAAYYFPQKGLIPPDAEVSYTEMFSPLPGVPAECDAAAVCAVLNDFPAVRSAFGTLFRGQGAQLPDRSGWPHLQHAVACRRHGNAPRREL